MDETLRWDESAEAPSEVNVMNRSELTRLLVEKLQSQEAVVAGIGNTNFDLWGAGDRPENFYMLGSMGLASPIALGVALQQPERQVFALEGDGSMLMQLGALTTIANLAPANLAVVLWDNRMYQITGSQPTATAGRANLVEIARAAGIAGSSWARDETHFGQLIDSALKEDGPQLIGVRIDSAPAGIQTPREPVRLKDRFTDGIGGKKTENPW